MIAEAHSKVQARHLKRNAYLYIRQSTLRQVFENTESTQRQYDLRHRTIAPSRSGGSSIRSSSSMRISGNRAPPRARARASSTWSPR